MKDISYWLQAQAAPKGGFYPRWRGAVRLPNGKTTTLATPGKICDKCAEALMLPAETDEQREARRAAFERCRMPGCRRTADEFMAGVVRVAGLLARSPGPRLLMREIFERLDAPAAVVRKAGQVRRIANDLRLVLAMAFDLWVVNEGGRRGVAIGAKVPDGRRIGELRAAAALSAETVRRYLEAAVDGELDWVEAQEGNTTIRSRLSHARDAFHGKVRMLLDGLELPDVRPFMKAPCVPVDAPEPEPIAGEVFAELVRRSEALRECDPDLWLALRVARQTGLRCGSLCELASDWVQPLNGGWRLVVRVVKGGTAVHSIPLRADTAEAILQRGGVCFGPDRDGRSDLVNKRMNAFLGAVIGEPKRGSQKAHRLRDTLAGALSGLLGPQRASEALGWANVKVMLRHYARVPMEATPVMREEFSAFFVRGGASVEFL